MSDEARLTGFVDSYEPKQSTGKGGRTNGGGFGFIRRADGRGNVFVHRNQVAELGRTNLPVGRKISFRIGPDPTNAKRRQAFDLQLE